MSEILKPVPHALVARFMYEDESMKHVIQANQYHLTPGEGIVFYGEDDLTSVAASFQQPEIEFVLGTILQEQKTLQLMAVLDMHNRGLLLSQGPNRNWGINGRIPKGQRMVGIDYGRIQFAGIWGESKDEVSETLRMLQEQRSRLN